MRLVMQLQMSNIEELQAAQPAHLQRERSIKNLLSNNNDARSITKYGFLVRPTRQIVALCMHCAKGAPRGYVLAQIRV